MPTDAKGPVAQDIAEMTQADYDEVFALWSGTEGVGLGVSDTRERIGEFLARNLGMCFVAREGGVIVGTILCGTDGRRGYLHHVAVSPGHRRRGIGAALVRRCMAVLKQLDIPRCHLFVFAANEAALAFYRRLGWRCLDEHGVKVMSCDVA